MNFEKGCTYMNGKPNILFLFSDQQRWDTLGCYGQKLNITPNLDQMAKEGVRFENAFTCQPVCGPARACLQTGKYATELGCFRNDIALPLNERTIANHLYDQGYETGYVGKWHLASNGVDYDYKIKAIPPERRGGYKDYWIASDVLEFTSHGYNGHMFNSDMEKVEFQGYRVDCVTDFALEFIRTRTGEKPFFLFVSYIEPHHQNDRKSYEGPEGSKEKFKDFEVPGDLEGTQGDWRKHYPDYLGCCNSLDYNLGRIRKELEQSGISEDTVIFYTSDHGSHFKTRNQGSIPGFDDYKRSCHDACIHIPMIAFGPGFTGGKVVQEMVSLIDIPPTILNSAGIEKPDSMRGRPLQWLLNGKTANWPEEVFLQISESQVGRAIRTKRWKYSVCAYDKIGWKYSSSDVYYEDFLYDLEQDPHEKKNLVADNEYKAVRKHLSQILKRRMAEAGEQVPEIMENIEWKL